MSIPEDIVNKTKTRPKQDQNRELLSEYMRDALTDGAAANFPRKPKYQYRGASYAVEKLQ